jgi:hypothetical protein
MHDIRMSRVFWEERWYMVIFVFKWVELVGIVLEWLPLIFAVLNFLVTLGTSELLYVRENQQMHQLLFNLLVMYCGCSMFWHYIAILRELS